MEKVYKDPKSGYTYGPFPKPTVDITVKYNCPTPRPIIDTTTVDSLQTDSLDFIEPIMENQLEINPNTEVKKTEEKKVPENQQSPATTPTTPLTKKEEREQRRKQRQEEKEKSKNGGN